MKIITETTNHVSVFDMEDGQIAEIIRWPSGDCVGRVVQRYGSHLITLGKESGNGWLNFFVNPKLEDRDKLRVFILGEGTRLEI